MSEPDQLQEMIDKALSEVIKERDVARAEVKQWKQSWLNCCEHRDQKDQAEIDRLTKIVHLLRRYHGGDGTVTREQVIEALGA